MASIFVNIYTCTWMNIFLYNTIRQIMVYSLPMFPYRIRRWSVIAEGLRQLDGSCLLGCNLSSLWILWDLASEWNKRCFRGVSTDAALVVVKLIGFVVVVGKICLTDLSANSWTVCAAGIQSGQHKLRKSFWCLG